MMIDSFIFPSTLMYIILVFPIVTLEGNKVGII